MKNYLNNTFYTFQTVNITGFEKSRCRFNRPAINETYDPGLMYYFLSTIADVSANSGKHQGGVNASAIYFSPNMSYTPSYRGFFNLTMPLFGPRTYR